jgi:hypothetical protein
MRLRRWFWIVAMMLNHPPCPIQDHGHLAHLAEMLCQQVGLSKQKAAGLLRDTSRCADIIRSLDIYYVPGRAACLDDFHRRFLEQGDCAFDIGAHVGDRTASFLRLGAQAIAVEPQPELAALLRRIFLPLSYHHRSLGWRRSKLDVLIPEPR